MPPFALVWLVNQKTVPIGQKVKFISFVALCLIFVSCGYFVPNGAKPEYYALRVQIAHLLCPKTKAYAAVSTGK